jgi:hypothetical protein
MHFSCLAIRVLHRRISSRFLNFERSCESFYVTGAEIPSQLIDRAIGGTDDAEP